MKITFWKGVFVADHQPGEEALLKRAGFTPHEPTLCEPTVCRACRARIGRRYFSPRVEDATKLRRCCLPRALAVMKDHLRRLASSRAVDSSIVVPIPAGLKYEPYQRAGIAYALQRQYTLFGDEPGLGKTIEALGIINRIRPRRVLVVCPATLCRNWQAEAEKWLVDSYQIVIPSPEHEIAPGEENLLVITNYEKLCGAPPKRGATKKPASPDPSPPAEKRPRRETTLSRSLRRPWDLLVVDESHYIKNPMAIRSQAILGEGRLHDLSRRVLYLSGTPFENYPREIWPVAAKCCPAKFGDWHAFARRYCGLHVEDHGGKMVWVADGSTNQSELQQKLRSSFMIRRLKRDVLPELPPKRRQLVLLDEQVDWSRYPAFQRWKELYQRDYEAALDLMEAARTQEEYRAAARALETVAVAFKDTSVFRHQTGLLKLPACLRYTDEMLASGVESLVIFAHHRDILQKIHEHYGQRSCVIYGDVDMDQRIPIVQEFQEGRCPIFIGGLRAAAWGITLTRASTVVFFETDWNPATLLQAEDRLCRYGQKKMVHVVHPVLDGSLDANMIQKVVRKQDVVDRVLDHPMEHQEKSSQKTASR